METPADKAQKPLATPQSRLPAQLGQSRPRRPPTLTMVIEALKALDEKKGSSAYALKRYILGCYPWVDPIRLKYTLKAALVKGLEEGYLTRPPNSSAKGATGRFKLVAEKSKQGKSKEKVPPAAPKVPKSKKTEKSVSAKAPAEEQGGKGSSKGEKQQPPRKKKTAESAQDRAQAKQATEEKGSKAPKKPRAPKSTQRDPASAPKGASKSHGGAKAPKKPEKAKAGDAAKGARAAAKPQAGGNPPLPREKPEGKKGVVRGKRKVGKAEGEPRAPGNAD